MIRARFYDPETGIFSGKGYEGPQRELELNTPRGMKAYIGDVDTRSMRVDPETGNLIPWRPDSPGAGYEWDGGRWKKSDAVISAERAISEAQSRIEEIERKSMRSVRELLSGDESARQYLVKAQNEIESARAERAEAEKTLTALLSG